MLSDLLIFPFGNRQPFVFVLENLAHCATLDPPSCSNVLLAYGGIIYVELADFFAFSVDKTLFGL